MHGWRSLFVEQQEETSTLYPVVYLVVLLLGVLPRALHGQPLFSEQNPANNWTMHVMRAQSFDRNCLVAKRLASPIYLSICIIHLFNMYIISMIYGIDRNHIWKRNTYYHAFVKCTNLGKYRCLQAHLLVCTKLKRFSLGSFQGLCVCTAGHVNVIPGPDVLISRAYFGVVSSVESSSFPWEPPITFLLSLRIIFSLKMVQSIALTDL